MAYTAKDTNKLHNAGDVVVEEVRLVSYNGFEQSLLGMYSSFTIFEDLFTGGLSGSLTFTDSLNLVKNFPIIGDETLYVTFRTPGVDNVSRSVAFKVYKISTYVQGQGSASVVVRIEFVSPFLMAASRFKMNRSYQNKTYSEIVSSIFSDVTDVMKTNDKIAEGNVRKLPILQQAYPTMGQTCLIIPNWTPIYAINWIANMSVPDYNQLAANYVFYETLDGYYFTPLDSMKKLPSVCTYKYIPGGSRSEKGDRMIETELRTITQYAIDKICDKMKESMAGMYSSFMLVNEMTTKSYYAEYFSYRGGFKETQKMNTNRLLPYDSKIQDMLSAYTKYKTKSHFSFSGVEDTNYIDHALFRQSLMNEMNSFVMILEVMGDSTMRVGNMIDLEFISPEYTKNKDDYLDMYLSGRYMITAIRHDISDSRHTMKLTVARDSNREPLPDRKEKDIMPL